MPAIVVAQPSRSIALSPAPQTRLGGHLRFAIQRNTLTARADNASGISGAQGTGIVFGVLGAVLLFVIWCFCCRKLRKKASTHRASPEPIRRPRPSLRPQPPKKEKKGNKGNKENKEKKQKKAPARRARQAPAPAPVPQPAPPPPAQTQRLARPRPSRVRNSRNVPPQPEPQPPQVVPQPPPPPPPPPPPEPTGPSVAERIRRFIPMSGQMMDFSRPPEQQVYIGDRITRNAQASESWNWFAHYSNSGMILWHRVAQYLRASPEATFEMSRGDVNLQFVQFALLLFSSGGPTVTPFWLRLLDASIYCTPLSICMKSYRTPSCVARRSFV